MIVPWNDAGALREATERYELAAILAEPVPANMGVVPAGRRGSSSCCASAPTRPARCSSSTR